MVSRKSLQNIKLKALCLKLCVYCIFSDYGVLQYFLAYMLDIINIDSHDCGKVWEEDYLSFLLFCENLQ